MAKYVYEPCLTLFFVIMGFDAKEFKRNYHYSTVRSEAAFLICGELTDTPAV